MSGLKKKIVRDFSIGYNMILSAFFVNNLHGKSILES